MKFTVCRSSWSEARPCEGAVSTKLTYKNNPSVRPDDGWVLEVDSLEQLMALMRSEGPLIVGASNYPEADASIEIYDGYRE